MLLKIMKVKEFEDLPTPRYMTSGSAGMDVYAAINKDYELKPGERSLISTGIHLQISEGFEAQIRPRSSLAINSGITLLNTPGTIDSDYRGEIKVIMINLSMETYIIKRGDRIAQIVFNKVELPNIEVVQILETTKRGSGGFGSTGK